MIFFGVNKEYAFEGPYTLGAWAAPDKGGIFAIMYRQSTRAERYAVIYLGEEENFAEAGFPFRHPQAPCWVARIEKRWNLRVAYLLLPGSTASVRRAIAKTLAEQYSPICNELEELNRPSPQES